MRSLAAEALDRALMTTSHAANLKPPLSVITYSYIIMRYCYVMCNKSRSRSAVAAAAQGAAGADATLR